MRATARSPCASSFVVAPRHGAHDIGACHMALFADPDGNAVTLHRHAPRVPDIWGAP